MEEQLSAAAARALVRARLLAQRRAASHAEPIDLLAALLADEESQAAVSLRKHASAAYPAFLQLAPPDGVPDENPTSFTPIGSLLAESIARAHQLANVAGGQEPTGTLELLAGLLEKWPDSIRWLREHGANGQAFLDEYYQGRRQAPLSVEGEFQLEVEDVVGRSDLARVVDANANRLREALRVLEDHARFVLNDAGLSRELKECRHAVREALEAFSGDELLAARDTVHDVGTQISTADEHARRRLSDLVSANAKRAQEALRSLEEYAKLESAAAARVLEQVRYRLYTLERRFAVMRRSQERLAGVVLYWLANPNTCSASLDWTLDRAVAGGVQVVQLRDKQSQDRELLALARQVRRWTEERSVLFIMNDRADLARLAGADGVHVGQEELHVCDARRLLGADGLIGVSTHNLDQVEAACRDGAEYIGVGPVFPSKTKSFDAHVGLDFVRQASGRTQLPAFAIGGVNLDNVEHVREAGATRIAVSHAISAADDPAAAARALRRAMEQ